MRRNGLAVLLWIYLLLSAGLSHGEEQWTHYLSGNDIVGMASHGDSLWCATRGSVVRWNTRNQTHTPFLSPSYYVPLLATAPDGALWLNNSSYTLSLFRLAGTGWIRYNQFTLSDSYDKVTSLQCDRAGNVWAGTSLSGAYRFDGSSWRNYPGTDAPLVTPRAVATDDSGAVWIGANDGLYRFHGGNWRRFTTQDGLAGNFIRCLLLAPDGALWVGTGAGASRFDGAIWKTFRAKDGLSSSAINDIAADRTGKIWLGTDNGVSCFDGTVWTVWKGTEDHFIAPKVTGIASDASNRIWMAHRGIGKGVTVLDGAQWKWYTTFNTDIPTNDIESVAAGSDGVLWFATGQGAIRYDGAVWKPFTTSDGMVSNGVREIDVDRNNRPWILYNETENAGVTRLGEDGPVTFSTAAGLPYNVVTSVATALDGTVWFGTSGGLSRFDGRSWENYPDQNSLLSSEISGITGDPDGVLWFATGAGITRFDGENWRTYRVGTGAARDEVTAISSPGSGVVWCMVNDTLMRFDNGVFTPIPAPRDSLALKSVITRIAVDRDGVVWTDGDIVGQVADAKRKILCFDGAAWKTITVPWPSANKAITQIVADARNVKWFGTDSGLVRLEGDSATTWPVETPFKYPINRVAVDREDVKWFISGLGYLGYGEPSSYDGKERQDYPVRRCVTVTVDSRNRKWFAGSPGPVWYDGKTWSDPIIPPKPSSINTGSLAIDEHDVLWAVTRNDYSKIFEIASYDGVEWKMFSSGDIDLSNTYKLAVDRSGTKWILLDDKGPVSFDGMEWKTYPEASIPEGGRWYDMAVDRDGVKWFASDGGVLSFDGKTWRKYTMENGFPFPNAYTIIVDRLNVKWFGTNVNLVSYDGTGWKIHEVEKGITMGISSMAVDMDNRKWIVWSDGCALSVLDDRPGADTGNIPASFSLRGNYPNPFNAETSIAFDLSVSGAVRLSVYDILGRRVRDLNAGRFPVGRNVIIWNGADDRGKRVSSGVYLYRLRFGGADRTGRMLFLK